MKQEYICTICGHVGYPKKITKGSFIMEIVLWIFFLIPGIIYSVWRLSSKRKICSACGNVSIIPADTPMGQKLIKENIINK